MSDLSRILTPDWLLWLLTLELLGLAALPLTALLFRSSPDRGYGLAKPLGMLLVAFLNWWLGSIADLANYAALLWILIVSLALCGLTLWRLGIAGTPVDFKSLKSAILVEEALFLAAFLVWSMVRSINPDILYSEKPMDFMLLQVSSMTHHYPPPDAWLSGQTVNYYYLGYAIFGMMGNMAGVDPRFGYDLSNITIFALGCSAGYALSLSLTKSKLWALAGAFSVMLAGNLEGVAQVIGQIRHGNLHLRGLSLWCSTRVLNGGCSANHSITEFPIFSVLWNDLHPHLIDLPFGLLSLGLGLHALQDPPTVRAVVKARYLYLGVSSLILGMLYAINSWDYPAYLLFTVCAVVISAFGRGALSVRAVAEAIAVVPASLVLYAPYFFTIHTSESFAFHANPTPLGDLLKVMGSLLIPVGAFVVWRVVVCFAGSGKSRPETAVPSAVTSGASADFRCAASPPSPLHSFSRNMLAVCLTGSVIAAGLVFVLPSRTDLIFTLLLGGALFALVARLRLDNPEIQASLLLAIVGALLLFLPDLGYIRDYADHTLEYRTNTVFKFYFQAWLVLAVVAPFAVYSVGRTLRQLKTQTPARVWHGAALLFALLLATYPIEGVRSQPPRVSVSRGLDGLAFVRDASPEEYAVVVWIRQHTSVTSVVAEAFDGDYWRSTNLTADPNVVSALTGRPTLIGWPEHEALWRGTYGMSAAARAQRAMIDQRERDLNRLYTTTDPRTATSLIRRYHIAYLHIGTFERTEYYKGVGNNPALVKFATFLKPVLHLPEVTLYQVPIPLRT